MPLILIADDNQQISGWLRAVLEAEGYRVSEAGDGREAMAAIEREGPDLMILDMYLPVQDGLETILLLQQMQSPAKSWRYPVIRYRDMTSSKSPRHSGRMAYWKNPSAKNHCCNKSWRSFRRRNSLRPEYHSCSAFHPVATRARTSFETAAGRSDPA